MRKAYADTLCAVTLDGDGFHPSQVSQKVGAGLLTANDTTYRIGKLMPSGTWQLRHRVERTGAGVSGWSVLTIST